MAWIKALSNAGAPSTIKLYDNGTWNMAYETPGSYTAAFPLNSASMGVSTFTLSGQASPSRGALIGSANAIDLSNFTMLKIKAQITGGSFGFGVLNTKNVSDTASLSIIDVNAGMTEYVIDVSSLTSGYVVLWCGDGTNRTATVAEITLA